MSLIDVITRVSLQASLPVFDLIVTNTDRTATELLNACHEAGEEITRRAEWSKLYASSAIPEGSATFTVPTNFHRLIQGGSIVYNASPFTPLHPVKAADVWAAVSGAPSARPHFFIKGGVVNFSPVIPAGGATMNYVVKNWILHNSIPKDRFVADEDTVQFSEALLALGTLWRYRRMKGLSFEDSLAEFEAELAREISADRGVS